MKEWRPWVLRSKINELEMLCEWNKQNYENLAHEFEMHKWSMRDSIVRKMAHWSWQLDNDDKTKVSNMAKAIISLLDSLKSTNNFVEEHTDDPEFECWCDECAFGSHGLVVE